METYVVDLTAGGRLSDLMETQFNAGPIRSKSIALQNLAGSGSTINFGSNGAPFHELLQGQTTILPIPSTKDIAFASTAVDVIVSIFRG